MRANINDLLTGAENKNAEKLLNQYLRDAREDYAQVKNETASVMAEEAAKIMAAKEKLAGRKQKALQAPASPPAPAEESTRRRRSGWGNSTHRNSSG